MSGGWPTRDAWYDLDGEYPDLNAAYIAAYARLHELDASQLGAGGQGGIQDQVWIICSDGSRIRVNAELV
jgi:hypothetical protein